MLLVLCSSLHAVMNHGATWRHRSGFVQALVVLVLALGILRRRCAHILPPSSRFAQPYDNPNFPSYLPPPSFLSFCTLYPYNSTHIGTMLAGRLTAPPRECYTLHRKLSGAFLSCIKLEAKVSCKVCPLSIWLVRVRAFVFVCAYAHTFTLQEAAEVEAVESSCSQPSAPALHGSMCCGRSSLCAAVLHAQPPMPLHIVVDRVCLRSNMPGWRRAATRAQSRGITK